MDAAILLNVISDNRGLGSGQPADFDFAICALESPESLRLGVPRKFFMENLDTEVEAAFVEAVRVLSTLVTEVRDVELDVSTDRTLQSAESYAYHRERVEQSPELYQPETLRRIMAGADVSRQDYERSLKELEVARQKIAGQFRTIDLLITPTIPVPAPSIAELKADPSALRPKEITLLRNTRPWNVWGVPTLSLPCGFTQSGLPIGLQIAGPPWREDLVLRLAHAYEQATSWHKREPRMVQSS
jgi:Asp-tRNA(Asn)/Glu-tRNA(Gln) amidotransferase A subunit family amidase